MEHDKPQRVLEYQRAQSADGPPSFRRADGWLLGVFLTYAAANFILVTQAFPPWGAFLAFAIPLPLVFIALAVLAHFLASPPLFNRWVLLAIILLVIVEAAINVHVAADVSASV